jgi:hypothetical protein
VDVALGDGEADLAFVWRARFVVVYAAANAAAMALAGTAACDLHLLWYVALLVLALAMATLQTLVLVFSGVRVSALRWWPLTFGGTAAVPPLAFGVVYIVGALVSAGLSALGIDNGTEAVFALVFLLPAAVSGVFVAGLQFFAFRSPPEDLLTIWFGANALAGFIGAPAIENVALGCANIGIGPSWIESPVGWIAAGALGGVLTGLVLARLRSTT